MKIINEQWTREARVRTIPRRMLPCLPGTAPAGLGRSGCRRARTGGTWRGRWTCSRSGTLSGSRLCATRPGCPLCPGEEKRRMMNYGSSSGYQGAYMNDRGIFKCYVTLFSRNLIFHIALRNTWMALLIIRIQTFKYPSTLTCYLCILVWYSTPDNESQGIKFNC